MRHPQQTVLQQAAAPHNRHIIVWQRDGNPQGLATAEEGRTTTIILHRPRPQHTSEINSKLGLRPQAQGISTLITSRIMNVYRSRGEGLLNSIRLGQGVN
jgi:hypothetical protein